MIEVPKTDTCVKEMQNFLRRNHADPHAGENSFLCGSSVSNQRIEWAWGLVRRRGIKYWMNLFQIFVDDGYFTGDYVDINLIRFCFMDMVQVCTVAVLGHALFYLQSNPLPQITNPFPQIS